ncbi:hypothetical protein KCP76_05335 [Salmonella enterica subsp. enterica serovar Weltevreden]|nr:hypothetical protein KCP76_05335 [Salmonella enterica subsp. enterica serovar Weltevreden]
MPPGPGGLKLQRCLARRACGGGANCWLRETATIAMNISGDAEHRAALVEVTDCL